MINTDLEHILNFLLKILANISFFQRKEHLGNMNIQIVNLVFFSF